MGLEERIETKTFVTIYGVHVGGYKTIIYDDLVGPMQTREWRNAYFCNSEETATLLEKILTEGIIGDGFRPCASDPIYHSYHSGSSDVNHFEDRNDHRADRYLARDKREVEKKEISENDGSRFYGKYKIMQKEDLEKNEVLYQKAKEDRLNNGVAELKKDSFDLYTSCLTEILGDTKEREDYD